MTTRRMTTKAAALAIWGALFLAACMSGQEPAPVETPTVTPTLAPSPTATTPPTLAPPTPTPSPSPPDLSGVTVNVLHSTSPDGRWRAEALLANYYVEGMEQAQDYARLTLRWESESGYREWTPYQEWSATGLGDSYLSKFYWSADGRYLYFSHNGAADGCGTPFVTDLRQVDLEDGILRDIPLTGLGLDLITLSPDAKLLVYRIPEGFQVSDLDSGESRAVPYEWPEGQDYAVDWYAWSPDGIQVSFTITENFCFTGDPATSIRVLNLASGEVRTLTEHDPRMLVVTGWPDPEMLEVEQESGKYLYAIDSGELLPIPYSLATAILTEFLNALHWGGSDPSGYFMYDRATELYGGSYEVLAEMNPDIAPTDGEALLRSACETNGFQCLPLLRVVDAWASPAASGGIDIHLTVELRNSDGGTFALGACCGEDAVAPPQTKFEFTVRRSGDGKFRVLTLPPYVP